MRETGLYHLIRSHKNPMSMSFLAYLDLSQAFRPVLQLLPYSYASVDCFPCSDETYNCFDQVEVARYC